MKDDQNMPLENLPEYLKSLKEQGSYGNSPVVQVGYIEAAPKKSWTGWLAATALLLAVGLGVGGVALYQSQPDNITVVVDIDQNLNPAQGIPAIFAHSGGEVLEVKNTEGTTYEVKVATHKDRRSFLERLLENNKIKKATIKE